MKVHPALKTEAAQHAFEVAFVVVVLILLPGLPLGKYGGGIAMMIASVVGLVAYFALFGERLRNRRQLTLALVAASLGALIALVLSLAARGQ